MSNATATLARSITRASSKQSYLIACLLVDKDLTNDCLRAYAYFRWADDVIDVYAQTAAERVAFIERQKTIVDTLYRGERAADLTPEEEMIADLIEHDRGENSALQSFIRHFITVLDFDARRKGRLISQAELSWYSCCLGKAVTDAIQYFIGNDHSYPDSENRYLAATAAHITHMLRDMPDDLREGFVNIPQEWLRAHNVSADTSGIALEELGGPPLSDWLQRQVKLARAYFAEGKCYLDALDVLRCKIAGYWYCARFESVLDAIERNGYVLHMPDSRPRKISTWLRMGWLTTSLILRHYTQQRGRDSRAATSDSGFKATAPEH